MSTSTMVGVALAMGVGALAVLISVRRLERETPGAYSEHTALTLRRGDR